MIVAKALGLEELVEVSLHQTLHDVHVLHAKQRGDNQEIKKKKENRF